MIQEIDEQALDVGTIMILPHPQYKAINMTATGFGLT